jgi:pimeloyl-ACP methyl ester carboxylesterase
MDDTGHTPQMDAPRRFVAVVRDWLEPAEEKTARVESP